MGVGKNGLVGRGERGKNLYRWVDKCRNVHDRVCSRVDLGLQRVVQWIAEHLYEDETH